MALFTTAIAIQSGNLQVLRIFRHLSSGCTVQRQAPLGKRDRKGRGQYRNGRGRQKFFARFACTIKHISTAHGTQTLHGSGSAMHFA